MEVRFLKYLFVLIAWFLVGTCFTANAQSSRRQAIWTSTASYRTKTYRPESIYTGRSNAIIYSSVSRGSSVVTAPACPTFRFQSTSSYISNGVLNARPQITANMSNGIATLSSAPINRPRRTSGWDDDEEGDPSGDGIGIVPNPAPIGEPFILLLMIALYLLCHIYKTNVKDDKVR